LRLQVICSRRFIPFEIFVYDGTYAGLGWVDGLLGEREVFGGGGVFAKASPVVFRKFFKTQVSYTTMTMAHRFKISRFASCFVCYHLKCYQYI